MAPQPLPALDVLLLESTYGNRRHEVVDLYQQLADVVIETAENGGVLLVPSFAVGRAQMLQHMLVTLMNKKAIPKLPIYLDSPMAIDVSGIYCHFSTQHKLNHNQCEEMCKGVTYTGSVDESKAIEGQNYPHIIIAGSGMASGGRILHHLKRLLSDTKTCVLFTGYQAGGTRGAKMLSGVSSVKIHGQWIPVKAKITSINGLSGHGDYVDIEQWLKQSSLRKTTNIYLVHGDPDSLEGMRDHLRQKTDFNIDIASYKQIITL